MVFLWVFPLKPPFSYGFHQPPGTAPSTGPPGPPQVIARSHAAGLGAPQRPFAGDAVQRVRLDAPMPRAGAATAGHGADGPLGPPRGGLKGWVAGMENV